LKSNQKALNLAMVGVSPQVEKMVQKVDKFKLAKTLREKGFLNLRVFSFSQIDFIQKKVMEILGPPVLPSGW